MMIFLNSFINGVRNPQQQVAQDRARVGKSGFEKLFQKYKGPSELIVRCLSVSDVAAVRGVCQG